jgi:hypothetical protein
MRGRAFVAVAVIKNNNNKLFSSLSSLFRGGTRGGSRLYLTTSGHIMMKTDDADNIMKHIGNDLTIPVPVATTSTSSSSSSSLSSSSSSGTYMLHRDWFIDDDKYARGGGEGHYDEYVANTTRCEVIVKSLPVSREVCD